MLRNAVHRALTFVQSKFEGVVPQPQTLREVDREILAEVERGFALVGHNIANCHFKEGINAAMAVARAANRYLDEQTPWEQIKQDRQGADTLSRVRSSVGLGEVSVGVDIAYIVKVFELIHHTHDLVRYLLIGQFDLGFRE